MLLSFEHDELKSYLKKITGYEVKSIYSIDNNTMWTDTQFEFNDNQSVVITAFCDATNTPGMKRFGFSEFLWNQTILIGKYLKFVRKQKLKNINKIGG